MRRCSLALLFSLAGLLALSPAADAADSLGRLFTTPEQREALDRKRILNTLETLDSTPESTIRIDGQVQRSSGKRTTWVNGQATSNESDPRDGVVYYPSAQEHDRVVVDSGDYPKIRVRVGETLNRATQETQDIIGNGKIFIHKAPPPAPR